MEQLNVNKFEIVDMPGTNTLAFLVEENMLDNIDGNTFYSLQKLDYTNKVSDKKNVKEFSVIDENKKQDVVLLTLTQSKAILSAGCVDESGFSACEEKLPLSYGSIYNQENIEYKEFAYTPNMKRRFSIVDTTTSEEVKPTLYLDDLTGEVKGKCKLLPLRPYVVLEIKGNYNRGVVVNTDGRNLSAISHGEMKLTDGKSKKRESKKDILKDESIV